MAITGPYDHKIKYTGLSTDTKPTIGVLPGTEFYETDTGNTFVYAGIYAGPTGAELLTWGAPAWDEDGITWTFAATVLTHITGNTTAVTATLTAATVVGTKYKVMITGTGGGGTATYTFGGVTGTIIPGSGIIMITDYITAASASASLVITPVNTCTAALTLVSVKVLTEWVQE